MNLMSPNDNAIYVTQGYLDIPITHTKKEIKVS